MLDSRGSAGLVDDFVGRSRRDRVMLDGAVRNEEMGR